MPVFMNFMTTLLEEMEKNDMVGYNIVLDNCSIHHTDLLKELVESCGHKLVYLPPYSPFLNPTEECWGKIKNRFERQKLGEKETVSTRVAQAPSNPLTLALPLFSSFFPLVSEQKKKKKW